MILALAFVVGGYESAEATTASVTYLDTDGTIITQDNATVVEYYSAKTTAWTEGWYVVNSDTSTITDAITVTGAVNLVLVDGTTLNASGGITLDASTGAASLTIWAGQNDEQTTISGSGTLSVLGIMSANNTANTTTLTINGGTINTTGSDGTKADDATTRVDADSGGAGVDGIYVSAVVINRGTVTAKGGNGGTGGKGGDGDSSATASSGMAGGQGGAGGYGITATSVTITGGEVSATGGEGAVGGTGGNGKAAIGGDGGNGGTGGDGISAQTVIISGGTLKTQGGKGGDGGNGGNGNSDAGNNGSQRGGNGGNGGANGNGITILEGGTITVSGINTEITDNDNELTVSDGGSGGSGSSNPEGENGSEGEAGKEGIGISADTITLNFATIDDSVIINATGDTTLTIAGEIHSLKYNGSNAITSRTTTLTDVKGSEISANYHTITFNPNYDGAETTEVTVLADDTPTALDPAPTRDGYTFMGWFTSSSGGTAYAFPEKLTEDLTLYAHWRANPYTITLNLDGGALPDESGFTVDTEDSTKATREYTPDDSSITLPTLTKTGYKFDGFFADSGFTGDVVTEVNQGSTGDKEFYAKFTANTYTIKFSFKGADSDSTFEDTQSGYVYEGDSSTINFPDDSKTLTRKGYTFVGWTTDSESTTTATYTSTGTKTLTADDVVDRDDGEEITLYAVWQANTYTITLNLNGGTLPDGSGFTVDANNSNKATKEYTVEDDSIEIPELTRTDNYNFAGWTGTTLSEATTNLSITPADELQNLTFTATWHKQGAFTPGTTEKPEVAYHSMVLGGNISVMFYVYFPKDDDTTGNEFTHNNSKMTFTVKGSSEIYHEDLTHSTYITDGNGYTLYGYECYLSSVEMADKITATIKRYGDSNEVAESCVVQEDYSALTYLTALTGDSVQADSSKELGRAIMNYGHYVQPILAEENGWEVGVDHVEMTKAYDYTDEHIAQVKTSSDQYTVSITDTNGTKTTLEAANLGDLQFSLLLSDDTTIRLYMKPKESGMTITAETNGVTYTELPVSTKEINGEAAGTYSYVDINGISAHELGDTKTVTITSEGTICNVNLSALSYVRAVLNSDSYNDTMKEAMTSLYYYYAATMKYRDDTAKYPEYTGATGESNSN